MLDDIIDLSTNEDAPLAVILRKVLVLSYQLKNLRLTGWANAELDGYPSSGVLPDYRIVKTTARGTFLGPFGAMVTSKPLPRVHLHDNHKDFADTVYLRDGIAKIESAASSEDGARMPWPADLVLYYQFKFYEDFALHEAWLDLPKQIFVGILDTVRTRTLRFALELHQELGLGNNDVKAIPIAVVERNVTMIINGGNNVIGDNNRRFTQTGTTTVNAGDQIGFAAALGSLGFSGAEIEEVIEAIRQDVAKQPTPGIGHRAAAWLAKVGMGALSVGGEAVKVAASAYLTGYLGIPP